LGSCPAPAMLSQGPRRRPLDNYITSQVSPGPSSSSHDRHEFDLRFNTMKTMKEILAANDHIIRRNERGNSRLPTALLCRVSALSESLCKEVVSLPPSTIPPLHKPLTIYGLILADIEHILSSNDSVDISDDTIDRRLDEFLLQFQEALDLLKVEGPTRTDQQNSPNSAHFFQNSHHFIIYGGNFNVTSTSTSNLAVHDPELREQSHKTLQVLHFQSWAVVLFYIAGRNPGCR